MNTRFTIEEENIVAIYAEDSRETTLENILAAMPYMDEDMRQLAAAAVNKLQAMTDSEFSEREFISLLFREVATLSAYGRKLTIAPGIHGQQIRHFPPMGAVLHVGNRRMDQDQK